MKQPLALLLHSLFLIGATLRESHCQVLPYEPIAVVKSLLSTQSSQERAVWKQLEDDGTQMRNALRSTLKPLIRKGQAVILSVRGNIVLQVFQGQVNLNTPLVMPSLNILSLLSTSIPILFEGFKPKTFTDKLGSIVKGGDKSLINGFESMTMLDLLNVVPEEADSKKFLEQLKKQADVAFRVANALLGSGANEAWVDSFMGVEMDDAVFDKHAITAQLSLLLRFTNMVSSEMRMLKTLQKIPYPHSDRFVFGWWLNCVTGGKPCLLSSAPSDTIASISPQLRMYVVPSLETMLIIADDPSTSSKSFEAIIKADNSLWQKIKATVSPQGQNAGGSSKEEDVVSKEKAKVKETVKEEKQDRGKRNVGEGETNRMEEEERKEKTEEWKKRNVEDKADKMEEEGREILWEEHYLPEFLLVITRYIRMYFRFTASLHWFYRGLLFAVFIIVTHYLCYAGFHCVWLFGTTFSKTWHKRRPLKGSEKLD